MPGLTNRRNAIREGTDWTKSETKGYGKVKKSKKKGPPPIRGHGYEGEATYPSGTKN